MTTLTTPHTPIKPSRAPAKTVNLSFKKTRVNRRKIAPLTATRTTSCQKIIRNKQGFFYDNTRYEKTHELPTAKDALEARREKTLTTPHQYPSKAGQTTQFENIWLPEQAMAGEKTETKPTLPKHKALWEPYIAANDKPNYENIIVIDVDHDKWHRTIHQHPQLPKPSCVVVNPSSRHAHLIWILATPIIRWKHEQQGITFNSIRNSLTTLFNADPAYSGVFMKNPLHRDHKTYWANCTNYYKSSGRGTKGLVSLHDFNSLRTALQNIGVFEYTKPKQHKPTTFTSNTSTHTPSIYPLLNKRATEFITSTGGTLITEDSIYLDKHLPPVPHGFFNEKTAKAGRNSFLFEHTRHYAYALMKNIEADQKQLFHTQILCIIYGLQNSPEFQQNFTHHLRASECKDIADSICNAVFHYMIAKKQTNTGFNRYSDSKFQRYVQRKATLGKRRMWKKRRELPEEEYRKIVAYLTPNILAAQRKSVETAPQRRAKKETEKNNCNPIKNIYDSENLINKIIAAEYVKQLERNSSVSHLEVMITVAAHVNKILNPQTNPNLNITNITISETAVHRNPTRTAVIENVRDRTLLNVYNKQREKNPFLQGNLLLETVAKESGISKTKVQQRLKTLNIKPGNVDMICYELVNNYKLNPFLDEDKILNILATQCFYRANSGTVKRSAHKTLTDIQDYYEKNLDTISTKPTIGLPDAILNQNRKILEEGSLAQLKWEHRYEEFVSRLEAKQRETSREAGIRKFKVNYWRKKTKALQKAWDSQTQLGQHHHKLHKQRKKIVQPPTHHPHHKHKPEYAFEWEHNQGKPNHLESLLNLSILSLYNLNTT